MSFYGIFVSIAKKIKKMKGIGFAIFTGILLFGCGGGGNSSPQSGGENPVESNVAVWDESNWDAVNWQ